MWILLSLLAALLWASASLVDKLAVDWGFRTLEVLPATYTFGFLAIVLVGEPTEMVWEWQHVATGAGLAIFSLLNAIALLMALRSGEVGLVSAVAGSHCVVTALAAGLLLGESLHYRQWLAIGLAVIGLFVIYGVSESFSRSQWRSNRGYRWFWLALLAAIGSSGETLGLKYATTLSSGGQYALLWEYFIAALVCHLLVAVRRVRLRLRSSVFGSADGILTGLGMLAFGWALALGPASMVATVATAAVLFRALGGIIFFGDNAGKRQWLGFGLLIAAFVLIRL